MKKDRVIPGRDTQDLTDFINKISIGKPYEVTNYKEIRNLDINTATIENLANVVATLVNDLKKKGIIVE